MTTTKQKPKKPRFKNKADRMTYSGAAKTEIECDFAVAPLDRLTIQMNEKWGIDRLPELVSVGTSMKFGSAMAKLNAAIDAGEPAETKVRAEVCMRGLMAMDREATEAGQPQASANYWEADIDGFHFAVMKDGMHWQACQKARPDLRFFSMREIGIALKALKIDSPLFTEVQKHFPKAEITRIAERSEMPPMDWNGGGDEIPPF